MAILTSSGTTNRGIKADLHFVLNFGSSSPKEKDFGACLTGQSGEEKNLSSRGIEPRYTGRLFSG